MSQTAVSKGAEVEKVAMAKHAADAPKTAAETSKMATGADQSTKSVEKPDEVITAVLDSWMVRPCVVYEEEYKECNSVSGRFHQRYVHGETLDCNKWYNDWKSCQKYATTKDPKYLEPIISQEKERRAARLQSASANTLWEYRTAPPTDWDSHLPIDLKNNNTEFLKYENNDSKLVKSLYKSRCTIM